MQIIAAITATSDNHTVDIQTIAQMMSVIVTQTPHVHQILMIIMRILTFSAVTRKNKAIRDG